MDLAVNNHAVSPGPYKAFQRLRALKGDVQTTLALHFRIDRSLACIIVLYLLIFLPLVTRNTENPQMLAAFVNDEPFLTMALEATQVPPYGNPANFFDPSQPSFKNIPSHWGSLRYDHINYYGGALYQIAFPVFSVLKAIGLPAFPTAPILLRLISLVAGLGSLILTYNIARGRNVRLAGFLACIYLIADSYFEYYVSIIHPDALQVFFGLLAFVFAVRHAETGSTASMVAFGVLAGLIQGTKVGGPWLVPSAALMLLLGLSHRPLSGASARLLNRAFVMEGIRRVAILVLCAIAGYIISTPYAFVDAYYFESLIATLGMVNADHLQQKVTIFSWLGALHEHVGLAGSVLICAVIIRSMWSLLSRRIDYALVIATTLSLSQFVWFASVGSLWHQIGYMLVGIALMATFGFEVVLLTIRSVPTSVARIIPAVRRGMSVITIALTGCLVLIVVEKHWYGPMYFATQQHLSSTSTVRAIGQWAEEQRLPRETSILFDDLAYFDPAAFPNARMRGGVLTWSAVETLRPDIIVLSSSLYGAQWYQRLLGTQQLDRWDGNINSVRLYQDLLQTQELGPTAVPGISLIKTFRPSLNPVVTWPNMQAREQGESQMADGTYVMDAEWRAWTKSLGVLEGVAFRSLNRAFYLSHMLRALYDARANGTPAIGPELRVFRLNAAGSLDGRPAGFASETAEGYHPGFAFDGTGNAWLCPHSGDKAMSCYVGYDFGRGDERAIQKVRIQWIYGAATPDSIYIEYSDDNTTWAPAATAQVAAYTPDQPNFRVDVFPLPPQGRHRYWRVKAAKVQVGRGFAASEVTFLDKD